MTIETIIGVIAQHGGTLGLAIFAIWMLNRVWADRVAAVERYAVDLRVLQVETREALDRNTEAWSRLMERVES